MGRTSNAKVRRKAMKFAKSVVSGKSNAQAYREIADGPITDATAMVNGSRFASKEITREYIDKFMEELAEKDVKEIMKGVVADAKGRAKKTVVVNSEGATAEVTDSSRIIASREQFLKIAHPAFARNNNLFIDNSTNTMSEEAIDRLTSAIERLAGVETIEIESNQDGEVV